MKPLCIYHGNCADGFGAAWVVWRNFGRGLDIDFHAGLYSDPPPVVEGRDIIIVDFSYKFPVLVEMVKSCNSFTLLDHHKTAMEDLTEENIDILKKIKSDQDNYAYVDVVFDMKKSGAVITWEYFNGTLNSMPLLLAHIQDRDLWKFDFPGTREIQAGLFSYPYDFEIWDEFMTSKEGVTALELDGTAIERKHFKDIHELLKAGQHRMRLDGYDIPVCNLAYIWSSDAGMAMAKRESFAACYWDTPSGRVFSLRSDKDNGVDVSAVAKRFGGGGHKNAAGFTIKWEDMPHFVIDNFMMYPPNLPAPE